MMGRWAWQTALLAALYAASGAASRGRQDVAGSVQQDMPISRQRDIYHHYPKHYYSLFEQRFQEYSKMHSEVSTLP